MKRIYLTGAAILLFIILGINYYYKKNLPTLNNDNAASAQTFKSATRLNPVDNAPAPPLPDTPPSQAVTQSTTTEDQQQSGSDLQNDKSISGNRSNTFYGHKKNSSSCAPHRVHHYAAAHRTVHHRVVRHTAAKSSCAPLALVPAPQETSTVHSSPISLNVQITKEFTGNAPASTTTTTRSTTTKMKEKIKYGGVKIGIEGGPNANIFHESLTHETTMDNMWMANFHAGLLFDIGLSRNWAIQVAPRYIGKGDAFQLNSDYKEKLSLHYLELPLDFVYKTGNPGHTRFMIGAGGYISYLASLEDHILGNDDNSTDPSNPPASLFAPSDVRTWDWGAGGFLGVETPVGFTVKAGGELGLRQLVQNTGNPGEYDFRNSSLLLSVGYLFGGARK